MHLAEYHTTSIRGHAGVSKTYVEFVPILFGRHKKGCEGLYCYVLLANKLNI